MASTSTYGAPSGPGTVIETKYDNPIPIQTFLCSTCYEPLAMKARRNVRLVVLLGLVGIGLFVLAYVFLVSDLDVPLATSWRNVIGLLAVLVGFLLVKLAWSDLNLRGELLWKTGGRAELHDVLHHFAHIKGKEIGCAQVWDIDTFKGISRSNEREKERDKLLSLWEKGIINEKEFREKEKEIYR